MSEELNRRLAAVVARKQAAGEAAASQAQATARAEADREAIRLTAEGHWRSHCLPMVKRVIEQINPKIQAGQFWIGINEALVEGGALAHIELRLHVDAKPTEKRAVINVNGLGKIQIMLPGASRGVEADVTSLSEDEFGKIVADFLDAATASPASGWEAR